ncbi:TonB-dependent receptor [Parapedobacter indicus]|uniref:Iron complex outermembrane recepter protein n=1 Tax=Parapedobacter indicus TaxID=1477437 RepID=A0A1I3U501_9SPHI|nr:TonB-dependent receptor [Parapedobacter indicus]PPK99155.1 iron complex outermembrane receptor protein [Parapedobacter indicus]SFJ77985.1 iron complex outermembrane recepter protein [Parapedobacter indicus]
MKSLLAIVLFLLSTLSLTFGQTDILQQRVSLQLGPTTVAQALAAIERETGYELLYSANQLDTQRQINVSFSNMPLKQALEQLLGDAVNSIRVEGKRIHFQPSQGKGSVRGTVLTSDGQPAGYVTVNIRGQGSTQTDELGRFTLDRIESGLHTLEVSYVGLLPKRVSVSVAAGSSAEVQVQLTENAQSLAEVVVTGQRRKTASITKSDVALLDIPLSIQVVDKTLLEQQLIFDVRDAIKNVSGITNVGTYAGGYADYNGRGFAMNGSSNFRRNGLYMNNLSHLYNDNIERIEVMKGPASVMYGDIAPGAVMNFVTKKPLDYAYRQFEMKVGQYGLFRPSFDLSGPLDDEHKLLYRINASYERSGSFIDHVNNQSLLFTPSVTWKITPRLSWNVEALFKNDERTHNPGVVSPDGTTATLDQLPLSRYLGEPNNQFRYRETSVYSYIDFELNANWKIRNSTHYYNLQDRVEGTYFPLTVPDASGNIVRSTWMTNFFPSGWGNNLDLMGEVKTGPIKHALSVGVDYLRNENGYNSVMSQEMEPINIFTPEYGLTEVIRSNSYPGQEGPRQFFSRTGVYLQDQLSALDNRVHLFAGLRYNFTSRGTEYAETSPAPPAYKQDDKNLLSPRVGLVVKPKEWLSVYGSYSQSYEQNGQDMLTGQLIDQTDADQLEVGVKTSLFRDRLGIGFAAFQINKENVFGYVYGLAEEPTFPHLWYDPDTKIASYTGAHHRSRGLELDVNGIVAPGLNVNLAASIIDARVVQDPAFESGNQLSGNARNTLNIWANYQIQRGTLQGLSVGYGFFYKDKFYGNTNNAPGQLIGSFWTMDASVGYRFRHFFVRGNFTNFTNQVGYLGTGRYTPQWVRRAILSFGTQF